MESLGDCKLQNAARPSAPVTFPLGGAEQAGPCSSYSLSPDRLLWWGLAVSRGPRSRRRRLRRLSLSGLRQPSCSCRVLVLEDSPCFRWDPRRSRHSTAIGRCARSPPALFFRHPPTSRAATSAVAREVGAEAASLACRLPAAQLGVGTWGKVPSTTALCGGERARAVAIQIQPQEAGDPPPLSCYSPLSHTVLCAVRSPQPVCCHLIGFSPAERETEVCSPGPLPPAPNCVAATVYQSASPSETLPGAAREPHHTSRCLVGCQDVGDWPTDTVLHRRWMVVSTSFPTFFPRPAIAVPSGLVTVLSSFCASTVSRTLRYW